MTTSNMLLGELEDTIPRRAPDQIALLRLDTDGIESTRHEIQHLYPRLSEGGVLIIDDYGHWQGARRAIDEYFAGRPILLNRDPLHRSHCDLAALTSVTGEQRGIWLRARKNVL